MTDNVVLGVEIGIIALGIVLAATLSLWVGFAAMITAMLFEMMNTSVKRV